ncbi:MAG: hypothetical protein SAL07_22300 [Oscillatoria sp. PMC 1051.18]|nr:hypothetical protein [Oscillatoria sp. PMC 1050.18]MEC5032641.1 hypothetical protein [Oscillatoria sp. PMC 1051.18]
MSFNVSIDIICELPIFRPLGMRLSSWSLRRSILISTLRRCWANFWGLWLDRTVETVVWRDRLLVERGLLERDRNCWN